MLSTCNFDDEFLSLKKYRNLIHIYVQVINYKLDIKIALIIIVRLKLFWQIGKNLIQINVVSHDKEREFQYFTTIF